MNRFPCPRCGRILESFLGSGTICCPCLHQFQVAAPVAAAAPLIPVPVAVLVRSPQNVPLARIFMVAGAFVAAVSGCAFFALLIIAVHLTNKDSATDADGPNLFGANGNHGSEQSPDDDDEAPPPAAGERKSPEPLRQAFAALGPSQRLHEIQVVQTRGKAHFTISLNVNTVSLNWQSTRSFKYVEQCTGLNMEIGFVLKGKKGWAWSGQQMHVMDKGMVADQQLFAYSLSLSNLLPLQESGFNLVKGENTTVRQRPCYTFKVQSAGRPDMVLCFDEETHLLAKSEFRGKLFHIQGFQPQDTYFECYYSNYKNTNGVNHWWTFEQYRNGMRYAELNLDTIQFFDAVQASFFALPGK